MVYWRNERREGKMAATLYFVRSAMNKHWTGRLVLELVAIWEFRLFYVFAILALHYACT
jgi:hypothetical protein